MSLRTWAKCSQCELTFIKESVYKNTKTGEIWCSGCLAKEKKKRLENYIRPEHR